jgi:putative transposase
MRVLIRRMARENPVFGEERIANELLVKLGIQVSPRTVRKYTEAIGRSASTRPALVDVLEESCEAILACDFFVAVTATCKLLYVFVVIEHGSRRLARVAVTTHPCADWTLPAIARGDWVR